MWIYHNDVAKMRVCLPGETLWGTTVDKQALKGLDDMLRLKLKCRLLDMTPQVHLPRAPSACACRPYALPAPALPHALGAFPSAPEP